MNYKKWTLDALQESGTFQNDKQKRHGVDRVCIWHSVLYKQLLPTILSNQENGVKAIIGHIILNVKDWSESELFYDKLLTKIGFEIDHVDKGDFGKMKSYKQGDHNLWIRYDQNKKSGQFVRDVGLDHLAFELKSEAEVDKIYGLIKKLNGKITCEPKRYPKYTDTYYAFYFRDPNGIPLEIYLQ